MCDASLYSKLLEEGASSKRKKYSCVVWTSRRITFVTIVCVCVCAFLYILQDVHYRPEELQGKIDCIKDLTLDQFTPVRVSHRRSLMSRAKVIFNY